MIVFSWINLIDSILTKQLKNVFLLAFLPQGRLNAEQYCNYFNNKIIPRLEKEQLIIGAYDKDKLVGFAIFEKWKQQSYYLAEMAVLPEYQRQDIGTQLVFSIFNKDKDARKIFLVTAKDNIWSQVFYEKIGFKHSSFQHADYPENFIGYEFYKNF